MTKEIKLSLDVIFREFGIICELSQDRSQLTGIFIDFKSIDEQDSEIFNNFHLFSGQGTGTFNRDILVAFLLTYIFHENEEVKLQYSGCKDSIIEGFLKNTRKGINTPNAKGEFLDYEELKKIGLTKDITIKQSDWIEFLKPLNIDDIRKEKLTKWIFFDGNQSNLTLNDPEDYAVGNYFCHFFCYTHQFEKNFSLLNILANPDYLEKSDIFQITGVMQNLANYYSAASHQFTSKNVEIYNNLEQALLKRRAPHRAPVDSQSHIMNMAKDQERSHNLDQAMQYYERCYLGNYEAMIAMLRIALDEENDIKMDDEKIGKFIDRLNSMHISNKPLLNEFKKLEEKVRPVTKEIKVLNVDQQLVQEITDTASLQ